MRKSHLFAQLLATTASLLVANSARAQDQGAASGSEIESVVVTGSLISRPGYTSPTPVTSLNATDLASAAPVELEDVLNQLPEFGAPATDPVGGAKGGNNAGTAVINLRNLGAVRTLVLLNGERVVNYSTSNSVDMNTLPQTLVKRVDVVTGGASAAYGSDAVAGVVNLILDTDYVGLKANIQYGNTTQGTYQTYKGDITFGSSFDGDRGHILGSISYLDSPDAVYADQEKWYLSKGGSSFLVQNPKYTAGSGLPQMIHVSGAGIAQATEGGLISSGPLKGTQFVGPNGTPMPFVCGTLDANVCYGGSTGALGPSGTTLAQDGTLLGQNNYNYNAFLYASYKLPFNVKAHVSLDYGGDGGWTEGYPGVRLNNITVLANNPYIPAQTQAAMTALKLTSFLMGSTLGNIGYTAKGYDSVDNPGDKEMERAEIGFDGEIGDNWSWSSYYTHGEVHDIQWWYDDDYLPNFNNAINAVIAPAGNSAGLAAGTIVCASTLTNPTNGCVPLDLFGVHVASPEAVAYIDPPEWTRVVNKQDAAQISVQGTPFSDWAGEISVVGGADYRSESATSTSNPLAYTHNYFSGNNSAFHGALDVWEGFGETIVPLAKDEWWSKQLDFNAAGRITDYSNSGLVETWKLGLVDQLTDEYRLRGTWSYDIRAPNLAELYTAQTSGTGSVLDPFTGGFPSIRTVTEGNPNLKPEISTTFSEGLTYTPNWLPGLTTSVDWYSINIKKAVGATPEALTYCYLGYTVYCPLVIRNSAGIVTEVDSYPVNTAVASTSGLDVEITYATELWGGDLSLHGLANYTDETTSTSNGVTLDNAGSVGYDILGGGLPKLKAQLSATYRYGPFSGTVQSRIWSAARYDAAYAPGYLDNNTVPAVAYLDLRGSYDFGDAKEFQIYFAADNVLDTPPPNIPGLYSQTPSTVSTRTTLYDSIGRVVRVGLRLNL